MIAQASDAGDARYGKVAGYALIVWGILNILWVVVAVLVPDFNEHLHVDLAAIASPLVGWGLVRLNNTVRLLTIFFGGVSLFASAIAMGYSFGAMGAGTWSIHIGPLRSTSVPLGIVVAVGGWLVPFLLLVALLHPKTKTAYGRRRRAALIAERRCPECEYSLIGNVSGACPECGEPVPSELAGRLVSPGPPAQFD